MTGLFVNWMPVFGTVTVAVLVCGLFSELSRHKEADHFGVDLRITTFSLRELSLQALDMIVPVVTNIMVPMFLTPMLMLTFMIIDVTVMDGKVKSVFVVVPVASVIFLGHYVAWDGLRGWRIRLWKKWENLKKPESMQNGVRVSVKFIPIMVSAMLSIAVACLFYSAFSEIMHHENNQQIYGECAESVAPGNDQRTSNESDRYIVYLTVYFVFLIAFCLIVSIRRLTGGYFLGARNKALPVAECGGELWLIAMRNGGDKWVLVECSEDTDKKLLDVYKGRYIVRGLEGLRIVDGSGFEMKVRDMGTLLPRKSEKHTLVIMK